MDPPGQAWANERMKQINEARRSLIKIHYPGRALPTAAAKNVSPRYYKNVLDVQTFM